MSGPSILLSLAGLYPARPNPAHGDIGFQPSCCPVNPFFHSTFYFETETVVKPDCFFVAFPGDQLDPSLARAREFRQRHWTGSRRGGIHRSLL